MKMRLSTSVLRYVVLTLLFSGLVLTACGDTATTAPTAAPATTTSVAATTTSATGSTTTSATGSGSSATTTNGFKLNTSVSGTIEFWHFWASQVRHTAISRVIAICKQQLPNITVHDTAKPFGDIWTANTAAVAAGSGMPDVIVEDRPALPLRAENNIETDLAPLAKRDGIDGSTFWPFTWQQTLYNNDTYGIPFSTDVRMLYWNKNEFKEVGLDPEKPPTTWAELEQYADKLDKKNPDGTYSRIAFFPLLSGNWDMWSFTNGAQLATADNKVSVNDPKVIDTITWMKKWVDRYGGWNNYQKFKGNFSSAPNDAFMSGKVAMYVDINGYNSQLKFFNPQYTGPDGKKSNLDYGVGALPYNTNKASESGGFALSIPKGSKNQAAAWEFIKCATSPAAQASWARDVYDIPANAQAAQDPTLLADPNWKVMVDAMSYTKPIGGIFVSAYANWGQEVQKKLDDIWPGKITDIKAAMDQAQQAIDAEIAKNSKK